MADRAQVAGELNGASMKPPLTAAAEAHFAAHAYIPLNVLHWYVPAGKVCE